jgi:hypothetical protein
MAMGDVAVHFGWVTIDDLIGSSKLKDRPARVGVPMGSTLLEIRVPWRTQ